MVVFYLCIFILFSITLSLKIPIQIKKYRASNFCENENSKLIFKSRKNNKSDYDVNLKIPIHYWLPQISLFAFPFISNAFQIGEANMDTIHLVKPFLDVFINTFNLLFLSRTIMSWYPKSKTEGLPFKAIVWTTEPLLSPVRQIVPPSFGVDISAIVWIMVLSFIREVMLGPQGLLTLMENSSS
jgi:YggT family protein